MEEGKDIFLSSTLLVLRRLLQDKLAHLLEDMAACVACQKAAEGSVLLVTCLAYLPIPLGVKLDEFYCFHSQTGVKLQHIVRIV